MRHTAAAATLAAAVALMTVAPPHARGGICWSTSRHGRCTELQDEKVSRDECCASAAGAATAWSADDLDAGTLFFWRVLGGGVPCHPCKETCQGVQCGAGKKCLVRKGQPKCVCWPHCRGRHAAGYRGPVCGTDGRTYRSLCKLRKRACRKNNAALAVAYHGACQSSCDRIACPAGQYCLLDQNLTPHCVRCSRRCGPPPLTPARPVCGVDRRTYHSPCHIRQAACRLGKAIPIAYKGKCIPSARCDQVHCSHGQRCLSEWRTGRPRCVSCPSPCQHQQPQRQGTGAVELCGTNNHTYPSWCHMMRDACDSGLVIETQFPGNCPSGDHERELLANSVLGDKLS